MKREFSQKAMKLTRRIGFGISLGFMIIAAMIVLAFVGLIIMDAFTPNDVQYE